MGANIVTVVGYENGGATGRLDIGTLVLVPAFVDAVKVRVIGGGVTDGRGLAANNISFFWSRRGLSKSRRIFQEGREYCIWEGFCRNKTELLFLSLARNLEFQLAYCCQEVDMNTVFETATIGSIQIGNRIIRSATHEGFSTPDGRPNSDKLISLYKRLAEGGAGAIITGYCGVSSNGKALKNMRMFNDDRYIEEYRRITAAIKPYGVTIINQLCHAGGWTHPDYTGTEVIAPSRLRYMTYNVLPREMTEAEILKIKDDFVSAIIRSRKAGFDGVQLHSAHCYLLSQFLSKAANRRTDKWGGSTENRFRLLGMIMKSAKEKASGFPILVKISAYDGDRGGMRLDESVNIAKMLQHAGCDAIEVSCGGINDGFNTVRSNKLPIDAAFTLFPPFRDMPPLKKRIMKVLAPVLFKMHSPVHRYNEHAAQQIKKKVNIPVIVVGGYRNIDHITEVIDQGKADFVAMSRPFIVEPGIVNLFREGKKKESACIDCAYCLLGISDSTLRCYKGKLPDKR